jgi:hypothetical protein
MWRARPDALALPTRLARAHELLSRMRRAGADMLFLRLRAATGIDELRSRRRSAVRPAWRDKGVPRRRRAPRMLLLRGCITARTLLALWLPAGTPIFVMLSYSRGR